jgi:hypothetical protein
MTNRMMTMVMVAAVAGCAGGAQSTPATTAGGAQGGSAKAPASKPGAVHRVKVASQLYLVDTVSQSCALDLGDGRLMPADCRTLAAKSPAAKTLVTWEEVARPAPHTCPCKAVEEAAGKHAAGDDEDGGEHPPFSREEMAKVIEHHIHRDGDVVVLDRDLLDLLLAKPAAFARQVRIVPSIKDGTANGFKLFAIRPGTLFARLGFKNGDTMHSVNGMELSSPDKALEAYTHLRDADNLEVALSRRGKPMKLTIRIE